MINDKDSIIVNSPYGMKQGNTIYDLIIGPFDTLFTKKIRLFARDGNGNISSKDLTLTIYPPVPEIQTLSGSIVSGNLNEVLTNEPIDIFRLRSGNLSRIEPITLSGTKTINNGTFVLTGNDISGIVLTQSGRQIATIDERTGKITLDDTSFHITAIPANQNTPMQIQILDAQNIIIFSEKMNISPVSYMEQVTSFNGLTRNGVMILPSTGFSFAKNTLSSPNLPEGGYITDINYKAIAGISK